MPPPTGQRTKRGSLAPTDINEAKPTSPRKEPPFKEPPSASPDGADIEAPANGGDSKQDGKKIDEPIDEAAQEEAGAASGSHRYTKLPTTDDAIEKVEDANEAVKSKFHHGKDSLTSLTRGSKYLCSAKLENRSWLRFVGIYHNRLRIDTARSYLGLMTPARFH